MSNKRKRIHLTFCLTLIILSMITGFTIGLTPINESLETARNAMDNGKYEEALIQYNNILASHPDSESALNNKGVALLRLGRCNESVKVLQLAQELNYTSMGTLQNLVFAELCAGDYKTADTSIQTALITYPKNVGFLLAKAMYERNNGNTSEALYYINQSIILEPENPELWYEKSKTLAVLNDFPSAYDAILIAESFLPSDLNIKFFRGALEEQLNNVKSALQIYDQIVSADPNFTRAWFSKGSIYYNHHRPSEAIYAYDQALIQDPNLSEAWFYRGLALNALDHINESAISFSKAVNIEPNNRMYQAYANRFSSLSQINIDQQKIRLPLSIAFALILIGCFILGYWKKKKKGND